MRHTALTSVVPCLPIVGHNSSKKRKGLQVCRFAIHGHLASKRKLISTLFHRLRCYFVFLHVDRRSFRHESSTKVDEAYQERAFQECDRCMARSKIIFPGQSEQEHRKNCLHGCSADVGPRIIFIRFLQNLRTPEHGERAYKEETVFLRFSNAMLCQSVTHTWQPARGVFDQSKRTLLLLLEFLVLS